MKKNKFILFPVCFSVIIVIYFIYAQLYRINNVNNNFDPDPSNYYETLVYPDAKEIIYDENYAVNIAIVIYEQLYDKTFSKDDFTVSDDTFLWLDVPCWRVCLNERAIHKQFVNEISTFDAPLGLLIYKKTGTVLMNNGELGI